MFDTDTPKNGLVDYAVCATVGGSPAAIQQTRVYSCGDTRDERCTGAVLLSSGAYCTTSQVTGPFPDSGNDTQATCDISAAGTAAGISVLTNGTLLNTCSYPSQEPNSDPSDCVLTILNVDTTVGTASSGTATWSATLKDTATMTPSTATGSVVFKLWSDSTCTNLIWTSASRTLVGGIVTAHDSDTTTTGDQGSPADAYIITNLTVDADGIYYWTVDYTPTGAFNGSSSACGEATTITKASVSGSN